MFESGFNELLIQVRDGVMTITLNRPSKFNALVGSLLVELGRALTLAAEDETVGAVVITGSPDTKRPAFAAGADISEMAGMSVLELRDHAHLGQGVFRQLRDLRKPTLAAVNGLALGGGCELAMACHLRYAAASASFGQPEINLGLIPGFAGTERLPSLVGTPMALELLLTGDPITADEAARIGLVNRVLPDEGFLEAVHQMAAKMAGKAPLARRMILELLTQRADVPMDAAQRAEADRFGSLASTVDTQEGLAAFLEKRMPSFKGR